MFGSLKHKLFGSEARANIVIYASLILFGAVTVIPFLYIFGTSVSEPEKLLGKGIILWPQGFELESFRFIFKNGSLLRSFRVTTFITVVGTFLNLLFTITAAYALSKRDLPGRRAFTMFIVLTMILSAGIIPDYMLMLKLKLIDSVWSLIFTGLVSGFNLLLMRNYFMELPESLIESAQIDGAKELRILFRILVPLSTPIIITIAMFYALGHWNEFFKGLIYININDTSKQPLQVVLSGIVSQADFTQIGGNATSYVGKKVSVRTIQAASIVAATIPMLLLFPFAQKYFTKGIIMGAVKG